MYYEMKSKVSTAWIETSSLVLPWPRKEVIWKDSVTYGRIFPIFTTMIGMFPLQRKYKDAIEKLFLLLFLVANSAFLYAYGGKLL